jgi:hypothetical protein
MGADRQADTRLREIPQSTLSASVRSTGEVAVVDESQARRHRMCGRRLGNDGSGIRRLPGLGRSVRVRLREARGPLPLPHRLVNRLIFRCFAVRSDPPMPATSWMTLATR